MNATAATITAIASALVAIGTLIGVLTTRNSTMATIQLQLIDPLTKRIDELEKKLKTEKTARQNLQRKVLRLIEGIKILTQQLCDNDIIPQFSLDENEEVTPDDSEPE